jgi:hypothetical protein
MGLLDSLEARLDKLVNGSFSKAFKSDIKPTELGAVLQQELDTKAKEIDGQLRAPNLFVIDLGSEDFSRLQPYLATLESELARVAQAYADEQRYTLASNVSVTFSQDSALEIGIFRVNSGSGLAPQAASVPADSNAGLVELISDVAKPQLVSVSGQRYFLTQSVTKIGRGDQAEIQIEDAGISRLHCAIILGSETVIRDLGSTNGTVVDGRTISETVILDGSLIKIGSTTLTYSSH